MKNSDLNNGRPSLNLVLFDFDGVIFNTNQAKTDAFRLTLREYPNHLVDSFIRYHVSNGGIGRKTKLDFFLNEIAGDRSNPDRLRELLLKFAQNCKICMASSLPLPGILNLLTLRLPADVPKAICSGGDRQEIIELLANHNVLTIFDHIWGNEESKMSHALERIRPNYDRVLFFGDARYDLDVAVEHNFDFVFVSKYTDWPQGEDIAKGLGHKVIKDFEDPILESILAEYGF